MLHTGAKFALSPINPLGFIDACHAAGLVAVPSGFTSNELWDLHRKGARMIKLFHAGVVGPSGLKCVYIYARIYIYVCVSVCVSVCV